MDSSTDTGPGGGARLTGGVDTGSDSGSGSFLSDGGGRLEEGESFLAGGPGGTRLLPPLGLGGCEDGGEDGGGDGVLEEGLGMVGFAGL